MAANVLPVELVELIFAHAASSQSAVKSLRLACRAFADIGFPYLFNPHFTHLSWRGDAQRLEKWSEHDRLRRHLRSWTLNLAQIDEYTGRHSSFFQYWAMLPEERDAVLREGWKEFYDKEARRKAGGGFEKEGRGLVEAAGRLASLEDLSVIFNECPYENDVLRRAFADPSSRRFEAHQVRETFELLTRVLGQCSHLRKLEIDRLPMTMRPSVDAENVWGAFAGGIGRRLEEVRLALDFSGFVGGDLAGETYAGWGELVGVLLMDCWSVKRLEIAKHYYHPLEDRRRKTARLNHLLLRDNAWRLTDLGLEGFATTEEELLGFVRRQATTLKRLRLGGRGVANPREKSRGGIWLERGSWFGFFTGLRAEVRRANGELERLHLEGDFRQVEVVGVGEEGEGVVEKYDFYPTADGDWEPVETPEWLRGRIAETALDGRVFEQYVLGDEDVAYPGFDL